MRKLILSNSFSPGDIVVFTAAVRDLHRCCPGQFTTDVRTPYPELWENNPWITPLNEKDSGVEVIEVGCPLIHLYLPIVDLNLLIARHPANLTNTLFKL